MASRSSFTSSQLSYTAPVHKNFHYFETFGFLLPDRWQANGEDETKAEEVGKMQNTNKMKDKA